MVSWISKSMLWPEILIMWEVFLTLNRSYKLAFERGDSGFSEGTAGIIRLIEGVLSEVSKRLTVRLIYEPMPSCSTLLHKIRFSIIFCAKLYH